MSGKFITLEGVDGSGKSHLLNEYALTHEFNLDSSIVALPKDSAGREVGDDWARRRLDTTHALVWSYDESEPVWSYSRHYWLFALAAWYRLFYDCVVLPELRSGRTVVTDGWYFKHEARLLLTADSDFTRTVDLVFGALPQPDQILLLDAPVDELIKRKSETKPTERGAYEKGGVPGRDRMTDFATYQSRTRLQLLENLRTRGRRFAIIEGDVTSLSRAIRASLDSLGDHS